MRQNEYILIYECHNPLNISRVKKIRKLAHFYLLRPTGSSGPVTLLQNYIHPCYIPFTSLSIFTSFDAPFLWLCVRAWVRGAPGLRG